MYNSYTHMNFLGKKLNIINWSGMYYHHWRRSGVKTTSATSEIPGDLRGLFFGCPIYVLTFGAGQKINPCHGTVALVRTEPLIITICFNMHHCTKVIKSYFKWGTHMHRAFNFFLFLERSQYFSQLFVKKGSLPYINLGEQTILHPMLY